MYCAMFICVHFICNETIIILYTNTLHMWIGWVGGADTGDMMDVVGNVLPAIDFVRDLPSAR